MSGSRSLLASAILHAVLIAIVLIVGPGRSAREARRPQPIEIVFFPPAALEPEIEPPARRAEPIEPEPAIVRPKPPAPRPGIEPVPALARSEPQPQREPQPARPAAAEPERLVHAALVDEPVSVPVRAVRKQVPRTGAFGEPQATRAAQPTPASRAVVAVGFADESTSVAPRSVPSPRGTLLETGFGTATTTGPAQRKNLPAVQQGGFGSAAIAATAEPRRRAQPAQDPQTPVEVLSKVNPDYTDEARRLRIEGEVVLEVLFHASGELRVLRVLERLGHGLDEAAVTAAQKIRYKAARLDGRAVDHQATLRVVFRLA